MSINTEVRPADTEGIARAAELLRQGELVALPTETVYGIAQPLVQHNVAPGTFEQLTGQPSQLVQAVLLCVVGFLAIYGIELIARIIVKKQEE